MPQLEQCGFDVSVSQQPTIRTGMDCNIIRQRLRLRHTFPGNDATVRVDGDPWSFAYNIQRKDVDIEYRTPVRAGQFQIKQTIPGAQWELLPTPEFKLRTTPVSRGKLLDELDLGYDLLASRARVEQRFELNGRYRLLVSAQSALPGSALSVGFPLMAAIRPRVAAYPFLVMAATRQQLDTTVTIRVKPGFIGASYKQEDGPTIGFKSELKRFGVQSELFFKKKQLCLALDVLPIKVTRVRLVAEAIFNQTSFKEPKLRLGARYEL